MKTPSVTPTARQPRFNFPFWLWAVVITFVTIVGVLGALLFWFVESGRPPKEAKLLEDFHTHRAAFERLRDMLEADTNLARVANWGVETDKGTFTYVAGHFPMDRYNAYLALLKETGGIAAARSDGAYILLWGSGFAGDTVHAGVCSVDEPPKRQVTSLDQYYQDHKSTGGNTGLVYRRVEGNWYLYTDIWSQ
jgi:hypothetical protein